MPWLIHSKLVPSRELAGTTQYVPVPSCVGNCWRQLGPEEVASNSNRLGVPAILPVILLGVAAVRIWAVKAAGESAEPEIESKFAATPATWGDDMDVPDKVPYERFGWIAPPPLSPIKAERIS